MSKLRLKTLPEGVEIGEAVYTGQTSIAKGLPFTPAISRQSTVIPVSRLKNIWTRNQNLY